MDEQKVRVLVGWRGEKMSSDKELLKILNELKTLWAKKIIAVYEEDENGEWDWKEAQAWVDTLKARGMRAFVSHRGKWHIVYIPK